MLNQSATKRFSVFNGGLEPRSSVSAKLGNCLTAALALAFFLPLFVRAQQSGSKEMPVVVQPGAPGQPTRTLPSSTRATLPPRSPKDAEFIKGMITHHAQAVEMTALIEARTENKEIRRLGARISQSQADEINFMRRWLEIRGETVAPPLPEKSKTAMPNHHHHRHDDHAQMPGMLSAKQMETLREADGAEFDRLFLKGMIQHHRGALVMVEDLFKTAGAGQDAELFNFATDVDGGQRAEIKLMQTLLGEKP